MTAREGTRQGPASRWAPRTALALLLGLVALGLVTSVIATRRALAHAHHTCGAIAPGTPLIEARRALVEGDGAGPMGAGASRATHDELLGVLGIVVGWNCQIELDAAGTTVTGTHFLYWMVHDYPGRWDDEARLWIEGQLL